LLAGLACTPPLSYPCDRSRGHLVHARSSTDIVGRIVLQKLNEMWGQPVPENRAGAGGSIGSAAVARRAAHGFTLLINSNAP
jgi:tripartite-type tricarboxylate transporter receptor subunit TctC